MNLIFVTIVALLFAQPDATEAAQPNIVWIVAEDMSPWLGCYGDPTVPTPSVDRLASEGTRYTHAYATTPVCAPSRSTLITGMYATTIGSMHMRTGNPSKAAMERNPEAYAEIPSYEATPPVGIRCFTEYLRMHGYYCSNNSKQDYQFNAPVTAWDASSGRAHWRNRAEGQPFFAVFNFGVTHESGTFPSRKAPKMIADPATVPIPPYYPDTPLVRQDLARTYDNIAAMDRQVGRILRELEEDGLMDETIIFFYSDHGVGLPRGKRSVYDSGTRVPLIIRNPNESLSPRVDERLVSFVDFAPTVLSLAGVDVPEYMQGHVFAGDDVDELKTHVFIHADRMDAESDRTRAVTDGRFRYIRHFTPHRAHLYPVAYAENIPMMADIHALRSSGESTESQWQIVSTNKPTEELYDTESDPHEVDNLAGEARYAGIQAALRDALEAWIERTGDLGMYPEMEMVKTRLWPPDGVQPVTATPEMTVRLTASGARWIEITCTTDGASVGYRGIGSNAPWMVYARPFEAAPRARYEAIAHRIGYRPSETVNLRETGSP